MPPIRSVVRMPRADTAVTGCVLGETFYDEIRGALGRRNAKAQTPQDRSGVGRRPGSEYRPDDERTCDEALHPIRL